MESESLTTGQDGGTGAGGYGTIATALQPVDIFKQKLKDWGGPAVLLIGTWSALLPIIAPLWFITIMNLQTGMYTCRCGAHFEPFSFLRSLCVVSHLGVINFPPLCRLTALFLVSWRFVRQRLFYVCLKNRILLDLKQGNIIALMFVGVNFFLLILVVCHMIMAGAYGNKREADATGHFHSTKHPLLTTSIGNVIRHPSVLLAPEHSQLLAFLMECGQNYVVPAIIAIMFACQSIDDAEAQLIPVSKLYKGTPSYVHGHIGESIVVGERVARTVLEASQEAEIQRGDVSAKTEQDTCDSFRLEALQHDSTSVIGTSMDEEKGSSSAMQSTATLIDRSRGLVGMWAYLSKPWWPLHLILKKDHVEEETLTFPLGFGIHCAICLILVLAELGIRLYVMIHGHVSCTQEEGCFTTIDMRIAADCTSVPLIFFMCFLLYRLSMHVPVLWEGCAQK